MMNGARSATPRTSTSSWNRDPCAGTPTAPHISYSYPLRLIVAPLPPARGFFSTSAPRRPERESSAAAVAPPYPAPMTITSYVSTASPWPRWIPGGSAPNPRTRSTRLARAPDSVVLRGHGVRRDIHLGHVLG